MLGTSRLKDGCLQFSLQVESNRELLIARYRSNGTGRSSLWVTGRKVHEIYQCSVPVELLWSYSVWVPGRKKLAGLHCGVPVEWKRRSSVCGTGGMEEGGLQFG